MSGGGRAGWGIMHKAAFRGAVSRTGTRGRPCVYQDGVRGPRWSRWKPGTALGCHSRPGPTRLPGGASPRLSPSWRPGHVLHLPPSSGTLPAPHSPGSCCVNVGVPNASVCPRPYPKSPHAPTPALPGWRFTRGRRYVLRGKAAGIRCAPVVRGTSILEGLRLRWRVLFLI